MSKHALDSDLDRPTSKIHKSRYLHRTLVHISHTFPVHPFFSKQSSHPTAFTWEHPLGTERTCLYGENLEPKCLNKIAAFDLDGTIIESNHRKSAKSMEMSWKWWRNVVPSKLKDAHESGFSVVIVSNQALQNSRLEAWKRMVPLVASALPDVPFRLFAAIAKDGYRKPMPGIWNELQRIFMLNGVEIDNSQSFYVGDAAGRKSDFASTDRKWAINVGVRFFTPEEYFLDLPPAPYELPGFHVSSLSDAPHYIPTSMPLLPTKPRRQPDVVLFVGYPCLGKSTFFGRYFKPAGYTHINQDTLGTRTRCIRTLETVLGEGKSCVIDNTNRDTSTRRHYINTARKYDAVIRCFLFNGSIELAWHNNLYRAYNLPPSIATQQPQRNALPWAVFIGYQNAYEEPNLVEGFSEIREINFVFEGTPEERRYWSMWLQIDGK